MAYVYQADIWCDDCGRDIKKILDRQGKAPRDPSDHYSYDSDDYPKHCSDDENSDSPQHCASGSECLNAEKLPSTAKVGLLFGGLTNDGVDYVREKISEGGEVAELWRNYYENQGYDFKPNEIDAFAQGYIECALWSETDNSTEQGGRPLDENYDESDIELVSLLHMIDDCNDFQTAQAELLAKYYDAGRSAADAGHDFWLTRNRHGAGFWDRGLGSLGDKLTDAAHVYGECSVYVGNDGRLHI